MKRIISILMLVCLLCSFAACGQQDAAVAIVTPEPVANQSGDAADASQVAVPDMAPAELAEQDTDTEERTVDANADQDRRNDSTDTGNSNYSGGATTSAGSDSGISSADKRSIAQGYIGSSLGALQSAIGAPNSSEYVISCLEDGLMDGILHYDGFVVWTTQMMDGSEIVKSVS